MKDDSSCAVSSDPLHNDLSMSSLLSVPVSLILPPLLLLVSLPLAALAVLTTFFAFATLLIRLSLVYVDLAGALVRFYLFPVQTKRKSTIPQPLHVSTSNTSLAQRRHSRRGSAASSLISADQSAPVKTSGYGFHHRNDSLASLLGAGAQGPARDFEGIGGWRDEDDDPDREAIWLGMNRRLELPAALPSRYHRRTGTGSSHASAVGGTNDASYDGNKRWSYGSGFWSPEVLRMSPVQSRARTPSITEKVVLSGQDEDGYFGLPIPRAAHGGEALVLKSSWKEGRRKSLVLEGKDTKREKHKNSSGESISSLGSKTTITRMGQ